MAAAPIAVGECTFIRIKRKANQDSSAAEHLILSAKRRRKDDTAAAPDDLNAVLRFVGTQEKNEEIGSKILEMRAKIQAHSDPRLRKVDLRAKLTDRHRLISKSNRLKLIDGFRNLPDSVALYEMDDEEQSEGGCASSSNSSVMQPEKDEEVMTCNGVPMVRVPVASPFIATSKGLTDCLYDIYYLDAALKSIDLDLIESINLAPFDYSDFLGSGDDGQFPEGEGEEVCDDEDDSNDELNWRNDYPEESNSSSSDEKSANSDDDDDDSDYDPDGISSSEFDLNKLRFAEDD